MTFRQSNVIGLLIAALLLLYAVYLQFGLNIEPCPLCIMQRLCLLLLLLVFMLASFHNPGRLGQRIYTGLQLLFALAGAGFALRQIYLQYLPKGMPQTCLPSITYMLQHMPLAKTLQALVVGTGQCGQISWQFLGLSTPTWTLLFFLFFIGLALWLLYCSKHKYG